MNGLDVMALLFKITIYIHPPIHFNSKFSDTYLYIIYTYVRKVFLH